MLRSMGDARKAVLPLLVALALLPVFAAYALDGRRAPAMLGASNEGSVPAVATNHRSPILASSPATNPFRPATSIIVRADRAGDLDGVATYATSIGYTVASRVESPPALNLVPPTGTAVPDAVMLLEAAPGVLYAEPSSALRAADLPADPLFSKEQPYLAAVHAPEAWDVEQGRPDVIVAVLDTGIDVSHPDLQGRIWTNAAEIPDNGIDDDGDGCIDDVHGCAFVRDPSTGCAAASDGNIRDDLGHGTFVSGIIAANGNGAGMVGVARGVTIMPVKVLDCTGAGSTFGLAQGILYAVQHGASVLNVSLGGPVDSAYIKEAIRIAHDDYGVLLVAATGNTGGAVEYPARYPNVLAVGATTAGGVERAPFSAAGPEVDVVAVGEGIIGTVPSGTCRSFLGCVGDGESYASGDGTSFAAPQVTGLVALMLSRRRTLRPDSIISIIKATADPLPAGDVPGWAGAGRVNMLHALVPQFRLGVPGTARD